MLRNLTGERGRKMFKWVRREIERAEADFRDKDTLICSTLAVVIFVLLMIMCAG